MDADQPVKRDIYSLDHLKPEVVAVTFAKCSRSPEPCRAIAAELNDEKSANFHEKWVVGYGHSSVAEHATVHMAIENVSTLAVKAPGGIEDNRLASYTEVSTRYQVIDKNKYYKPQKIMDSPLGALYEKTMDEIFEIYGSLYEPMREFIIKKYPIGADENDRAYQANTKGRVCDNTRYLLPTATMANLGLTANARQLEHMIAKMLSHPLDEIKDIGNELKQKAMEVVPTLIKFANANQYIKETDILLKNYSAKHINLNAESNQPVEIVDYDRDAENKLVAALLYKHADATYHQIKNIVAAMPAEEKQKIVESALAKRASFDQPIRELEHVCYTFDILMDYGGWRDIQRHRMCTQTNQSVTIAHGYDIPEEIIEAGFKEKFTQAMDKAIDLYNTLYAEFPEEAQYAVPMAFKKRVLITWNLRELHHFISLRSGIKGHISYRRIAQECWRKLNEIQPLMAKYIRVNMEGGSSSWASTMYNPEYNYAPKK